MRKLMTILVISLLGFACSKKSLPVISDRTNDPPAPASPVADLKPDLVAGQRIYANRCGKCHDLPEVSKYKPERWEGILKSMVPRAGLSREQEVHLKAWVMENAAK